MTAKQAQQYDFFICPGGSDAAGDGSADRPFASVARVTQEIAARHGDESPSVGSLAGYDQVRIAAIAAVGESLADGGRISARYAVDPTSGGVRGDGSAEFPWPDLTAALEGLAEIYASPDSLQPGQLLLLDVREVFTSTRAERRRTRDDRIANVLFLCMTIMLVIPLAAILSYLLVKAWPALSVSFIWENPRDNMLGGGIWAPLIGTFYLVCISLLVAAPIGVLAGVYLNEYARDNWFTRIINLGVVNLAGVPSIVHALFGVGAFVTAAKFGYSVMAASCTLAIMTLPVIITSTKEALASVPMAFREACWNMGASRWQTIRTIVLPNSISGILTGVILQVSRAAGETAPILFTGAVFYMGVADHGLAKLLPYGIWDSCMALSYHLYAVMSQVAGDENRPEALDNIRYGTAVVLIGLVLAVNSLSISLRVYLRSRKKW